MAKPKITKKSTPQKLLKLLKQAKPKNLTPQKPLKSTKQQILSKIKTKKRIEIITEKLKELRHKPSKYLDELDKKILKLDEYYDDDDFELRGIENVQDLFKILIYKPTLVKSGYNNNYIQYESKGDNILTIEEYLALIERYLRELINDYKSRGEWKIQLTA